MLTAAVVIFALRIKPTYIQAHGSRLYESIMRLAEWCQTVRNPKEWIFLSTPNTHDRFFSLHNLHFWKWVFDNAVTLFTDLLWWKYHDV